MRVENRSEDPSESECSARSRSGARGTVTADAEPETPSDLVSSFGVNAGIVAEIRHRYAVDPDSVHPSWGPLFDSDPALRRRAAASPAFASALPPPDLGPQAAEKHARVLRLIHSYRARGHRIAKTDPLEGPSPYFPELDPAHYGFGTEDLGRPFIAGDLPGGPVQTLAEILDRLRGTYCGSVGAEFTHSQDPGRKQWLQQQMETTQNTTRFEASQRLRILQKLAAAELFERFIHTRFLGQKRFSLEGAESLIPLLDEIVEVAPDHGVREIVFGMAHRGRLNVMSNVLGRSLPSLFSEFEDVARPESPMGSGDVKYHKGFSSDRITKSGERVHLSLTANPSHLEAVDPVVEGRVRAKQVRSGDREGKAVLPLLIHGDAAFAGQGIVAETLNLSKLPGYTTGGTIHVVVNNQIGFTTTPNEARSTLYATDVAKMIQAPIFHVNADDPEAVLHTARLAFAYRQRFGDDVVIDLVCYRRHGHNEGDEPSYTNPLLYEKVRSQVPVRMRYTEILQKSGVLGSEDAEHIEAGLSAWLAEALDTIHTRPPTADEPYDPRGPWTGFSRIRPDEAPDTSVPAGRLAQIGERLAAVPNGFAPHPKLERLLERRRAAVAEDKAVDWALGEALAFGTLLLEGYPVRLSGQDSTRGTFSQRQLRGLRQPAVRGRRAGIRVRIQRGRSDDAQHLGGPVRRLREWGAGDHRPVHLGGPRQVAPHERAGHASAPRLRGSGAGTLERAHRAIPAALRRRQHPDRELHHAGAVLPRSTPADAEKLPPAARDLHTEESAASAPRHLARRRLHRGRFSPRAR
jgi:2-oxoglutarate dehydrogenase E1 component